MKSVFQQLMRKVWPAHAARARLAAPTDDLPAAFRRSEAFAEDLGDLVTTRVLAVHRRRWRRRPTRASA